MKSQEILNELKNFPKEYNPTDEKMNNTLNEIMNFYDKYEKKNKRSFSFHKWQAAAAGLAAVFLACFLFLPNMLHQEQKENASTGSEKKTISKPAQKQIPISNQLFHSKELAEVKAISISNSEGIQVKRVTDPKQIALIVSTFQRAKFVEKQNKEKENSINGKTYLLDFELKDGLIPVQYWPNETGANFIDGQERSWWRNEDLSVVLDKILPSEFISTVKAMEILKSLHPDVNWEREYSLMLVDKEKTKVYKATGILPSGELIQLYLDPSTGSVISQEQPETTVEAVKAVETFYHLVSSGNYQMAWDLIHSKSQKSAGYPNESENRKLFNEYFKTYQLSLKKVNSAEWTPMTFKFADCMCAIEKEVLIKASLSDGSNVELHAVKDDDNQWKLYWSTESKMLK